MNKILLRLKGIYDRYIGDSNYKRNVLTMVGGRVIAQVVPILLSPLLTRIYSPAEFGVFGVYSTIVSLVALISNGRYCLSIILPKKDEDAQTMVLVSSFLTIIVSVLFLVILFVSGDRFFNLLDIKSLSNYLFILFLSILLIGLYEALFYYELREKKYKVLAVNIIVQAGVVIAARIALGLMGHTDIGLILSFVLGYTISYVLLIYTADFSINFDLFKSNVKHLVKRYSNFPRFSLFSDTLYTLSMNLPNVLLNKAFGSAAVGYFSLSDKILGSPIWLITSSVGDVFKQEASEQYRNEGNCKIVFEKTTKTLFYIGIIPFIMIFALVPPLIPFIFGEIWTPVGEYIRIFSLMYFSSFVVNPTSHMVYIVDKQQYAILFQVVRLISVITAFILGFYYKDLILGLVVWSVLITLTNVLIFTISYKFARDSVYVETDK